MRERNGERSCRFSFPKDAAEETTINPRKGHPDHRRRCRHPIDRHGRVLDDRWVSTYSPYLLLKYKAHLNVEVYFNDNVVKYIIKYINKGQDSATMALQDGDEIGAYQRIVYIGPHDAMWRIDA